MKVEDKRPRLILHTESIIKLSDDECQSHFSCFASKILFNQLLMTLTNIIENMFDASKTAGYS